MVDGAKVFQEVQDLRLFQSVNFSLASSEAVAAGFWGETGLLNAIAVVYYDLTSN